ncbi:hypothetical protein [Allokutzneria sp. NRRL B-24872]|uniref:hypothetical protein n=1 Tax=Allokutzneria sp. NRRL B-24872 TaxID=1137961 RepID=UPI000A3C8C53|nr:hypothetical protein [Allokutzneria sp. NRRL B-24872]
MTATRRLQILVVVCSVVFTIGTALQNFVIVNHEMLEHTMRLAGRSADPSGFLTGFRIIGCVYIVGNAIGLLALTRRKWVFWAALTVNLTQAAGVVMIKPEVFQATFDLYGFPGLLPSIVTDGGALLLALALIASLIRHRAPWASQVT